MRLVDGKRLMKQFVPVVYGLLVLIGFGCTRLTAQAPPVAHVLRSRTTHAANQADAELTELYSNLGSSEDAYDDGISWGITGAGNPLFGRAYLAMPFTVAEKSSVKQLLVALGDLGGAPNDEGVISIFTDEGGVPGKPLRTWKGGGFPAEGTCCTLVTFKDLAGVALESGAQYWIVASLGPGQQQNQYQWNFVWNDALGNIAFLDDYTNGKWLAYPDNVAAFAVYGTID